MKLTDLTFLSHADPYDIGHIVDPATKMLMRFDELRRSEVEKLYWGQRQNELKQNFYSDLDRLGVEGKLREYWRLQDRMTGGFRHDGVIDLARRAAEAASAMPLPDGLDAYRLPQEGMTLSLLKIKSPQFFEDSEALTLFNNASAMARAFEQVACASSALAEATRSFSEVVEFRGNLKDYRDLLEISGLRLPRWPTMRLLTAAEKRRKLRGKLTLNAEPPQVRRAKSLVHRWERTMREVLDDAMVEAYGEDWAQERLTLCGCKDLLGKWRTRGGSALDHADYAHYAGIVSHPDHFSKVFSRGFDDAGEAYQLFQAAGRLRAASHHGRDFTTDDLKDLTLIWRTIEKALLGLMDDYVLVG